MKSFLISFGIALLGGAAIYYVQADSVVALHLHFNYLSLTLTPEIIMPVLTMITKFGLGAASFTCYSASFCEDRIFPSSKRATATAMCNIIARLLAIFAP